MVISVVPSTLVILGHVAIGVRSLPLEVARAVPALGISLGMVVLPWSGLAAGLELTRGRSWLVRLLSCALSGGLSAALFVLAFGFGPAARLDACGQVANDLDSVVQGLHDYVAAHGSPPEDLYHAGVMIPGRYRSELGYRLLHDRDLPGSSWVLTLNSGWGMGYDSLVYLDNEKYPTTLFGGHAEPVGRWAYIHD